MQGIQDFVVDGIIRIVLSDSAGGVQDKCVYMEHPEYNYVVKNRSELPSCAKDNLRLVIVSDTHDCHHKLGILPSCDLLVHCGDIMMTGKHFSHNNCVRKLASFNEWLLTCDAKQRIVLGGNHDRFLEKIGHKKTQEILSNAVYLENTTFQLGMLSIWGTPLSNGKSPNRAFQSQEFLRKTLNQKPSEVDILITHGLCEEITSSIKHKIHIWGHSHNSYGIRYPGDAVKVHSQLFPVSALSICAPIMNGRFKLRNLPVVVDIPKESKRLDEIPTAADMVGHTYAVRSEKVSTRSTRYSVQTAPHGTTVVETELFDTSVVKDKPITLDGSNKPIGWFGLFGQRRVLPVTANTLNS